MRKKNRIFFLLLFLFFLPLKVLGAGVVLNEVFFDPSGSDTGKEWIELYNPTSEEADISGWEVYLDGTGYFTFPQGIKIGAGKFAVLSLRTSGIVNGTNFYHTTALSNMGNTSGSVALFSGEPRGKETIKDFVEWGKEGQTWEGSATDAGLWEKGKSVGLTHFSEGNSIALAASGFRQGADSWIVASVPTPGLLNAGAQSSASSPSSVSATNSLSPTASPAPAPVSPLPPSSSIRVDAGEDLKAAVGATINFMGHAFGLKGVPLENARFWWNFGDGESQEGRNVGHIFRIPGSYMIGLHVNSGELAGSDYVHVDAVPNRIAISGVLEGAHGYVKIENPDKDSMDIGNWTVQDSEGHMFMIPPETKISPNAEIALSNEVTGLLKTSLGHAVSLHYPNGETAFSKEILSLAKPYVFLEKSGEEKNSLNKSTPPQVSSLHIVQKPLSQSPKNEVAAVSFNHPLPKELLTTESSLSENKKQHGLLPPASLQNTRAGQNREKSREVSGLSSSPYFFFGGAIGLSVLASLAFFFVKVFFF